MMLYSCEYSGAACPQGQTWVEGVGDDGICRLPCDTARDCGDQAACQDGHCYPLLRSPRDIASTPRDAGPRQDAGEDDRPDMGRDLCGDGVVSGPETCEPGQMLSCEDPAVGLYQPVAGGEARCQPDCRGWDGSECGYCGDGVTNGTEVCDRKQRKNCRPPPSRRDQRAYRICRYDCSGWDDSHCHHDPRCGNGVLDEGEVCDTALPETRPCTESYRRRYDTGEMHCNDYCDGWSERRCSCSDSQEPCTAWPHRKVSQGSDEQCGNINPSYVDGFAYCGCDGHWDMRRCRM